MNILAIETSSPIGGAALVRDGVVLREAVFEKGMEHGRELAPRVDALCRAEAWAPLADIDLVAVSQGPGSFTGLRVGIAFAKGVAFAASKPMVGVGSLDVIAENVTPPPDHACVVLDARRGDVFYAVYRREADAWRRIAGPALGRPEEALGLLPRPAWVLGEGVAVAESCFNGEGLCVAGQETWAPRPGAVGLLGERIAREGTLADVATLGPIYLRRPAAEERRLADEGREGASC